MQIGLDIQLLKVIHTICVHGSAQKAAKILNMSVPGVSYALNKARGITGHNLFIRSHSGLIPDTMAVELNKRYQEYVAGRTYNEVNSFSHPHNTLIVHTVSPIELVLARQKMPEGENEGALRYMFTAYNADAETRISNLLQGNVDIDIGGGLISQPQIQKIRLFTSDIVVLASTRSDHAEQCTVENWFAADHIVWASSFDWYSDNVQSTAMAASLLSRRNISVVSGNLMSMAAFCASTNNLMIIPRAFSRYLVRIFSLKCIQPPDELSIKCDAYMHFNNSLPYIMEHAGNLESICSQMKDFFTS